MTPETALTSEDRCWPCTVGNIVVGLLVAAVPLGAAVVRGETVPIVVTSVWAVGVLAYTCYRLLAKGYLPYSETIARWTGLHERIGPGKNED